jgi:hypothetical protein
VCVLRYIFRSDKEGLPESTIEDITDFYLKISPSIKPSFHAWIRIDENRFLDVVGPGFFNINEPYFDELVSKENNIYHHEVLTASTEVNAFYQRLKSGTRVNEWANT